MKNNIKNIFIVLSSIIIVGLIYLYINQNNIDINDNTIIILNEGGIIKGEEGDHKIIGEIKKEDIKDILEVEVITIEKENNLNKLR